MFEAAESDMPSIKVRLLVSINRNQTLEDAQETLAAIKEFNSPYIVGIELSGDPRSGSFDTFSALIDEFRQESGLKVSIHCAEVEEQMNETQAIIDFNPDRLGHCVWMVSRVFALNKFSSKHVLICSVDYLRLKSSLSKLSQKVYLWKFAQHQI